MILDDIIIVQRDNFTIIDKPACVSTIPDKTEGDSILTKLEKMHKRTIHPITRLDKVVSGLCLFAHNPDAAARFSDQLHYQKIKKIYIAILEGKLEKEKGNLSHHLTKHGAKTKVSDIANEQSKEANLSYEIIQVLDNYTIVKIELQTGRFHQIRAQFSAIGHPIKGDIKYGARRKNKDRSIHLHAWSLKLPEEEEIHFAPIPNTDNLWKIVNEAIDTAI